jgi:hypothetical protein
MNKDELKSFCLDMMEKAKKNLQEDGDLMPVLFFRDREKRMHIMGLTKLDEDIKSALNGKVKQYAKAIGADAVAFITDSYLRFADPETGLPGPRRGEMITISAVTPEHSYLVSISYKRAKAKHLGMGKKYVFVFEDPVEYDCCNFNRFLDGIWDETKQQIH